jgi:kynurenine formamidase
VGKGVLLDYCSWAERKGLSYNPMSKHVITVADLIAIAEDQDVTFRPGDILLVRTGWIKWYEENNEEQRLKYITHGSAWVGVEGCQETLEWLWNSHFAAVAGDSIGWEAWPPKPGYSEICFRPILEPANTAFQNYMIIFYLCGECQSERCGILKLWPKNVRSSKDGPSS